MHGCSFIIIIIWFTLYLFILKSPRTINDFHNNLFVYENKMIRSVDMACTNGELKCMNGNWYICENNAWENAGLNGCTLIIPYPPKYFPSQPQIPQDPNLETLDVSGGWTCIWTVKDIRTWIYIFHIDGVNEEINGYVPVVDQSGTYSAYTMTIPFDQIKNFVKDIFVSCESLGRQPEFPPKPSDPKPPINYNELVKCKEYWTYLWTRRGKFWTFVKDVITITDSNGDVKYKVVACSWSVTNGSGRPIEIQIPLQDISDYYKFEN